MSVSSSRLPTLTALCLALLLGAAPWRVCAHGEHAGLWIPAAHTHGAHAHASHAHASHAHASSPRAGCAHAHSHGACAHSRAHHIHGGCAHRCAPHGAAPVMHAHGAPQEAPAGPDHCHCDDQPLVASLLSVPVQLAAPVASGWLRFAGSILASTGATEVARPRLEGGRVPREDDPNVLLR